MDPVCLKCSANLAEVRNTQYINTSYIQHNGNNPHIEMVIISGDTKHY